MSRGGLLGWVRAALWSGSFLLCVAVTLCYAFRPTPCALVTIYPAWGWAGVGLTLAGLSVSRASRTRSVALLLAWLTFMAFCADDIRGAVRFRRAPSPAWEQAQAEGRALRVVSLNCAGGDIQAAAEPFEHSPDLVLLQESPPRDRLEKLLSSLPGNWSFVCGPDTCVIGRGTISAAPLSPEVARFAVRARTTASAGAEIDVVSVRLVPPVLCLNLLSPDCWRTQSSNLESRRAQVFALLDDLADTPSSIPLIVGGDLNAPAGDGSLRPLADRFRDAFTVAGHGWGNTATNDTPLLRVDQVWLDRGWQPVSVVARETEHSDHRMVICDLILTGATGED